MIKRIMHFLLTTLCTKFAQFETGEMGLHCRVNYPSKFSRWTIVGNDCHFNGIAIYGFGNVVIGNHFHCGKRCKIITSNHNYKSAEILPYDDRWISEDVTVGDNVWLGMDVTVLPGVSIGEGAIIQAGSVVVSDIPCCAIAGGHPAKVFSYRDVDTYWKIKSRQQ